MRFTAARTFFTWSRSSPAKFLYIPTTVHFWNIAVSAFLCLVVFNCNHVVCTSRNTSTPESRTPTTTVLSRQDENSSPTSHESSYHNRRMQECDDSLLNRTTFCRTIALELCRDLRTSDKSHEECRKLEALDNQTRQEFNKFEAIMERVDCRSKYSVKWNCSHCRDAYKDWICETNFTEKLSNLRPSNFSLNDLCYKVIKRCPYFLPATDNQYSGQPVFDCKAEGEE